MGRFGVELLLVIFSIVTALGFILTYCIAVELNHVNPYLPYISDTGGKPPESCVFTFICSLAIFFELLVVYIRYKVVHTFYSTELPAVKVCNVLGLVIGVVSAIGFLVVASFQDDNVPIAHFIGAFTVFGGGILYQWTQTYINARVYKAGLAGHIGASWLTAQVILSVLTPIFFLVGLVLSVLAGTYHHVHRDNKGSFHWSKNDGGFIFHVISTACEWSMSLTFLLYFLTFHPDFKRVKVDLIVRQRAQTSQRYSSIVNDETTPLNL